MIPSATGRYYRLCRVRVWLAVAWAGIYINHSARPPCPIVAMPAD